jgi:hypothetical protein
MVTSGPPTRSFTIGADRRSRASCERTPTQITPTAASSPNRTEASSRFLHELAGRSTGVPRGWRKHHLAGHVRFGSRSSTFRHLKGASRIHPLTLEEQRQRRQSITIGNSDAPLAIGEHLPLWNHHNRLLAPRQSPLLDSPAQLPPTAPSALPHKGPRYLSETNADTPAQAMIGRTRRCKGYSAHPEASPHRRRSMFSFDCRRIG